MSTEVVVALIAAFAVIMAGVPSAFIERARRENADDHAAVRRRLDRIDEHLDEIEDSVDDVAEVLGSHLSWHDKEAKNVDTQQARGEEDAGRRPS
jgi:hypothetical protein